FVGGEGDGEDDDDDELGGLGGDDDDAELEFECEFDVVRRVDVGGRGGDRVVTRHLEFLGPLWKVEGMESRLRILHAMRDYMYFGCFYLELPPTPSSSDTTPGTFIALPPSQHAEYFIPIRVRKEAVATVAPDEIDAHVNMFDSQMGFAYFDLMEKVAGILVRIEADYRRGGR
ncbi:hypothetical protein HK101_005512, partial [Irineochytrium annulatum]